MTGDAAPTLVTVGHGTMSEEELADLLCTAGVALVVDVRSAPGSRRHPQFGQAQLAGWLPAAGIGYRWEGRLGGFRRTRPDSANVALRHPSFRGYADYMATPEFHDALAAVLQEARQGCTAVMCAETLWWRCHRRLIADAAVLAFGSRVRHLGHDGRLADHRLTDGARLAAGIVVYDVSGASGNSRSPVTG
ncbi:MAG: DUF488 family protein [Acidimicrobiales bacterium]